MSLQVEKLEKNMAKLTIEVSAEDLDKAMEKAYQKQKSRISLPGFRKGKAPRKMIESMYGKGVFMEDAVNSLVPQEYTKALGECDLEIVSQPEINVTQMEPGKALIFTADVAVKPEVTLGDYKGVEVPKSEITVTDEEVDAEVKKEQDKNARTVAVEDRAAANGDITTIDFEGFVDGVAFEGGKGTDYALTLGSSTFIPGFEDQLVGANTGDHVEVLASFSFFSVSFFLTSSLYSARVSNSDTSFANSSSSSGTSLVSIFLTSHWNTASLPASSFA